jgi:hypothetical protein
LREEHKLRVVRRIFGPKRDDVTEDWRRLHIEELYALYCSPDIIWGDQIKKTSGHGM